MTEREVVDVEEARDTDHVTKPSDMLDEPYQDPDAKPEVAGLTLGLIIGGIALTMIITMAIAFVYFNNFWEGPTSALLPWLI